MEAKNLRQGEWFEIPKCEQTIKNLVCLRVSHGCVYVEADERRDKESPWKRDKTSIGLVTTVKPSDKPFANVQKGWDGVSYIVGSTIEITENGKTRYKKKKVGGGRGRKTKELSFPKGKFIIADAAKANDVSTTCVYLRLEAMRKIGEAKIVGEVPRREGQRGKATKIWRILT